MRKRSLCWYSKIHTYLVLDAEEKVVFFRVPPPGIGFSLGNGATKKRKISVNTGAKLTQRRVRLTRSALSRSTFSAS